MIEGCCHGNIPNVLAKSFSHAAAVLVFFFAVAYMAVEVMQLLKLGVRAYFDSFWNFLDLAG